MKSRAQLRAIFAALRGKKPIARSRILRREGVLQKGTLYHPTGRRKTILTGSRGMGHVPMGRIANWLGLEYQTPGKRASLFPLRVGGFYQAKKYAPVATRRGK